MLVKCQICKEKVDRDTAYKRIVNGKNLYYHSEQEYQDDFNKKLKKAKDKDFAYKTICKILGQDEIINTALWKEWQIWNQVADDEKIGKYLNENKDDLSRLISRLNPDLYPRIRYLSTVLKNKLGDYNPKVKEDIPIKENSISFFDPINVPNRKNERRSFADLEDDET